MSVPDNASGKTDPLPDTLIPRSQTDLAEAQPTPAHVPAPTDGQATLPPQEHQAVPPGLTSWPPGYEMLRELGRGGMGVVYLARQVKAGRLVALKMILAGAHAEAGELARFRTEAESIARLQHPNIVQVFEVGEHQGFPFFSLEYCAGGSLAKKLNGTPQEAGEASRLVEVLARAMQGAHEHRVIHRDLKPANVLLLDDGTPKVTDFGLAKKLDDAGQTRSGAIMGTPSYMAPEQADERAKQIGPPADVYALGAVLYECLTGRPPFKAATTMDTLIQVLREEPVPPSRLTAKVPRDLETICLKCLHKEPAKRYATALEMANDLRRFEEGKPIAARPVGKLERGWRWCRRNPAVAGLLLAVFLTLGLGAAVATLFAFSADRARADQTRETLAAERARDDEKTAREKADRNLYLNRIALAKREWEDGNVGQARDHLDATPPHMRGWEYHYLLGLAQNPEQTLRGHVGAVNSVAISADGSRIVSGGEDSTVKVWDAQTGRQTHSLQGHTGRVASVAVSPDGLRAASAGEDTTVKVWDIVTGQPVFSYRGHTHKVTSVAFSPDGQRIVSGASDALKVWNAQSGKETLSLVLPAEPRLDGIRSVCFSPDGRLFASAALNFRVSVTDAETGKEKLALSTGSDAGTSVAFSPDGLRIALGSWVTQRTASESTDEDGQRTFRQSKEITLRVWDARTGRIAFELEADENEVSSVAFSPDSRLLASGGKDRMVKLWDPQTGVLVRTLKGHMSGVSSVAFSADGKRIVSGSADGTVKVWDAEGDQAMRTLKGQRSGIHVAAFSPDSQRIVSASDPGVVKVWDGRTMSAFQTVPVPAGGGRFLAISPDCARIVSQNCNGELRVWDAQSGEEIRTLKGHTAVVICAAFTPDGRRLVSGSDDRTVKVWDTRAGQELYSLRGHTSAAGSVAVSPGGDLIASAGGRKQDPGEVRFWNANTGEEVLTLSERPETVQSMAFSPDGKHLVTGSVERTVRVRDVRTGMEVLTLQGHTDTVNSVAYSPDGKRIISASNDKTVRLWDARTGQEILSLMGNKDSSYSVAFSPDGKRIASVCRDHTIGVWDSQTDQESDRALRLRRLAGPIPAWHQKQAAHAEAVLDAFSAAFHLQRLLSLEPWDADLHVRRAHQLTRMERHDLAAVQFLQAVTLDPRVRPWPVDEMAYTRGWYAVQKSDWPRAAVWFELETHQPKPDDRAWTDLLLARLAAGQTEDACRMWRELAGTAKETDEAAVSSLVYCGPFLALVPREVERLVKLAEDRAARQRDAFRLRQLGTVLYRAGQYQEAARILEELVDGKDGQADNCLVLALAKHQLGQHEEARKLLDRFEGWHRQQNFANDWQGALCWKRLQGEANALIRAMPRAKD